MLKDHGSWRYGRLRLWLSNYPNWKDPRSHPEFAGDETWVGPGAAAAGPTQGVLGLWVYTSGT
ncbi:hypothetical protein ACFWA1_39055, partial [Streptomyces sp. NPDC060005]|uniref:hypothetical protein n=1 Tax=Streptomyces sp. NPDC060005 TaxID=3347034 RepID=UPI0036CB4260